MKWRQCQLILLNPHPNPEHKSKHRTQPPNTDPPFYKKDQIPFEFRDTMQTISSNGRLSSSKTISAIFKKIKNFRRFSKKSDPIFCHGHKWEIQVHHKKGNKLEVYLRLLESNSNKVCALLTFRMGAKPLTAMGFATFQRGTAKEYSMRFDGTPRGALDIGLLDSSWNLEVHIDIQVVSSASDATWVPPQGSLAKNMLQLLESGENADVAFVLDGSRFPANQVILGARSNFFKELFQQTASTRKDSRIHEISIRDANPSHFELLLRFLYADEVPSDFHDQTIEYYQDIIQLANQFECVQLKFMAEAKIIDSSKGVTADNAADLLLFADAHCCALLREKAIEVFSMNPKAVMATDGWSNIATSNDLLNLLMQVLADEKNTKQVVDDKDTIQASPGLKRKRSSSDDDCSYKHLRVNALRKELYEKGLELDGSREMLIARLREADNDNDS